MEVASYEAEVTPTCITQWRSTWPEHLSRGTCVAVCRKYLAVGHEEGLITVLDRSNGGVTLTLCASFSDSGTWCLAFVETCTTDEHGPHTLLVSGGVYRTVRVWDIESGTCMHKLEGHASTVRCLCFSDTLQLAVTGSRDTTLLVWNPRCGGASIHTLYGHTHNIRALALLKETEIVSASDDKTARIWDITSGQCRAVLHGHEYQLYAVVTNGDVIATGSLDSTVRLWNANSGACLTVFKQHQSLVSHLSIQGLYLASGGSDGKVVIYDLNTLRMIREWRAHERGVTGLLQLRECLLTSGSDGKSRFWNISNDHAFANTITNERESHTLLKALGVDEFAVLFRRDERLVIEVIKIRLP